MSGVVARTIAVNRRHSESVRRWNDRVASQGTTLTAAARVLHALGAREVLTATVARTPRPGEGPRNALYTPDGG